MKVTIIPADGAVYKDGVCVSSLDLSFAPQNVHALQWLDSKGWIEFSVDENFVKPANENIGSLPDWATTALQKWEEANANQTGAE